MNKIAHNCLIRKMNNAFDASYRAVNEKILEYGKGKSNLNILDIGCFDFVATNKYLINLNNYKLYAVDRFDEVKNKDVTYKKVNLEGEKLPFKSNMFDIIIAGQVIEHILNKDLFLENCYRVLKRGGLFVCATENIASFDNILSLLFGQEPLAQHGGSKYNMGSRLSPHFMMKIKGKDGNKYMHKNVCSYYSIQRLFKINGFNNSHITSMGNINFLFEKVFKPYNRLILVFAIK